MPRVSLTKKQLATAAGQALLGLLTNITRDGDLSAAEVEHLRAWLAENGTAVDVPAIAWLSELVQAALADGKVTADERAEMLLAFDRVLPPEERIIAKMRRNSAPKPARARKEPRATERQLDYMRVLGIAFDEAKITKEEASDLISAKLGTAESVSNRQLMVLRFWNRLDLVGGGKRGVSEWLDEWYTKDQRHREAWELWKRENGDDGRQGDPGRVPVGVGPEYLKRVETAPAPTHRGPIQGIYTLKAEVRDRGLGWFGDAIAKLLGWAAAIALLYFGMKWLIGR